MIEQELYGQRDTARILGVEYRWLDAAPISWVDIRKPGAKLPVKRWRRVDIDAFIEARTVLPGMSGRAR